MLTLRRLAFVVDAVCVLVFASVGRSSHEEGASVVGVLTTAWPFLVGLVVAWAGWWLLGARRDATGAGAETLNLVPWTWTVPVVTWAVGIGLRVIAGQGVSGAFPLVALAFLVVMLLGWRAVAAGARAAIRRAGPRRSAVRAPGTPGPGD